MSDLAMWAGLAAMVIAGLAVMRFNPEIIYSRTALFRLAVIAVLGIGLVLMLAFFGAPLLTPSGVANPNGG